MKKIYMPFVIGLLFSVVQYANCEDIVKVQRAQPKKQVELQTPEIPKQIEPPIKTNEVDLTKQKAKNLQQIKQYTTNLAKKLLWMSEKEIDSLPICDIKYTLEGLGASNIMSIVYYEPDMNEVKKVGPKVHGWEYKPKRCAQIMFDYENTPYYTTWCR